MTTQVSQSKRKNKAGFYIEVGCPGCGAGLKLDEDFFVTTCQHCDSVLRLVRPDAPPAYLIGGELPRREIRFALDRFLKEHDLPLTDSDLKIKSLYYPFWKMDAALLRVRNKRDRKQVSVDSNYEPVYEDARERSEIRVSPYMLTISAGVKFEGIPESLGFRTEFLKLIPFSDSHIDQDFDTCAVARPHEEVQSRIIKSIRALSEINPAAFGTNVTEVFNPKFALIFSPYYIVESYQSGFRRFIVDGITSKVLKYHSADHDITENHQSAPKYQDDIDAEILASGNERDYDNSAVSKSDQPLVTFGQIGVEFHRCTTCGSDLPDERSYLYVCGNCDEIKTIDRTVLPVDGLFEAVADKATRSRLFPFWALKVPNSISSEVRPLFGGTHDSDRIVIPAFKAQNFEANYRLAKRMSAAFPLLELSPVVGFDQRFSAVEISMEDAIAQANLMIYRRQVSKASKTKSLLPKPLEFSAEQASVIYVPFRKEQYFFVDCQLDSITFEITLAD